MQTAYIEQLNQTIRQALDDVKAQDVSFLEVEGMTSIADTIVIASGTSDRHVKSIAQNVIQACKDADIRPLGTEGLKEGEWVLVDLGDTIVHVMMPQVREFYNLEKLWDKSLAMRHEQSSTSRSDQE